LRQHRLYSEEASENHW